MTLRLAAIWFGLLAACVASWVAVIALLGWLIRSGS